MYPHDCDYPGGIPELHNCCEGAAYLEPDYMASCADAQLPLISTIGRGPMGEGLCVGNVVSKEGETSFALYSTLTGELVWQSPNLAPPVISFKETDWRELVPGVHAPLDITVSQGGVTDTSTVWLPAGQVGSRVYLLDLEMERTDDDTYTTTVEQLTIYGRREYDCKPDPRPNDIVYFRYRDAEGSGFAFGTIETVGETTRLAKVTDEQQPSDLVVFTARTFVQIPPVTIGEDGTWCVDGVSTGVKAQGEKGDKGDKGDPGEKGVQGETGEQGERGPAGRNATVRVARTVQLEPGASAYVTDTDPGESDAALEFGIPEGRPATIAEVGCTVLDPGEEGYATVEEISSNENTYRLVLALPRGEDGRQFDVQHGIWTIETLPDFDETPINTVFVVEWEDGTHHFYIRGRIAYDAELGGPWTVVDDWIYYDQLPDRIFDVESVLGVDVLKTRRGRLPVEWGTGKFATATDGCRSTGVNSHAEGINTLSAGMGTHAEGSDTIASSNYSHAEGYYTSAYSGYSHAEGYQCSAQGTGSHVEGWNTKVTGYYQHAQGKHNIVDKTNTYAHIVGNGTELERSNAHTLDWSGNSWYAGEVTATDAGGDAHNLTEKVDKADLHAVAFSGSYNDLEDKPATLDEDSAADLVEKIFD